MFVKTNYGEIKMVVKTLENGDYNCYRDWRYVDTIIVNKEDVIAVGDTIEELLDYISVDGENYEEFDSSDYIEFEGRDLNGMIWCDGELVEVAHYRWDYLEWVLD